VHAVGANHGTIHFTWDAFANPDKFEVFYEGALIFTTTTFVSGTGMADIPFGPGTSTFVTVVVTTDPTSTVWTYTVGCVP
jgi:hypothetical protein